MINAKELFPDKQERYLIKFYVDFFHGIVLQVKYKGKIIYPKQWVLLTMIGIGGIILNIDSVGGITSKSTLNKGVDHGITC